MPVSQLAGTHSKSYYVCTTICTCLCVVQNVHNVLYTVCIYLSNALSKFVPYLLCVLDPTPLPNLFLTLYRFPHPCLLSHLYSVCFITLHFLLVSSSLAHSSFSTHFSLDLSLCSSCVQGELMLVFSAFPVVRASRMFSLSLPNELNWSFDYYYFLIFIAFLYLPSEFALCAVQCCSLHAIGSSTHIMLYLAYNTYSERYSVLT